MKKIILLQLFCLSLTFVNAQWTTSGNNIYNSNAGNVGIGTTNPQYRLHLFDNSSNQLPNLVLDGQNGMTAGFLLRNLNTNGKNAEVKKADCKITFKGRLCIFTDIINPFCT